MKELATRIKYLDMLRGFALFGIPIVNYNSFARIYATSEMVAAWPLIDKICHFLQYLLFEGKFYTIFSVLFGISFSIILKNALSRGDNGKALFYRRMLCLLGFGAIHLFLMWAGDILFLYSIAGMLLPLFYYAKNRTILITAALMLLAPFILELLYFSIGFNYSAFVSTLIREWTLKCGFTRDEIIAAPVLAENIFDFWHFTLVNSIARFGEWALQHRFFKVFGLFLIGFYLGRNNIIANMGNYLHIVKKFFFISFLIAFPLSIIFAYECYYEPIFGKPFSAALYLFSVYPLSFSYMAGLILLYFKFNNIALWRFFETAGKMSLTVYLAQSFFAIFIFYGLGLALGGKVELYQSILIAISVYCIEVLLASLWFKRFNRGPLEAIWRKVTN